MPPLPLILHQPTPLPPLLRDSLSPFDESPGLSQPQPDSSPLSASVGSVAITQYNSAYFPLTTTTASPSSLVTPAATSLFRPLIVSPTPTASGSTLGLQRGGLVRVKSFPHTADLLGNASESSSRTASRVASPVSHEGMDMDVEEEAESSRERERTVQPNDIRRNNLGDMIRELRERRHREERDLALRRSDRFGSGPRFPRRGGYRQPIRPRIDPEPPHLAAFDRDAQLSGFNELGLVRDQYTPTAHRPREESLSSTLARGPTLVSAVSADTGSSLGSTNHEAVAASARPTDGSRPSGLPRPTQTPPRRGSYFPLPSLALGEVGEPRGERSPFTRRPMSPGHIAASIPAPRRSYTPILDTLDFSPQRQMREDREVSRRRRMLEETIRDLEARGEERSIAAVPTASAALDRSTSVGTAFRSRYHRERLARLDALRSQQPPTYTPPIPERNPNPRLGVANLLLDEMVVDGVSVNPDSTTAEFDDGEGTYRRDIDSWNRDVQDAINRRLPDLPRSSTSARPHREDLSLYAHPSTSHQGAEAGSTARPARDLWGELPDDFRRHDLEASVNDTVRPSFERDLVAQRSFRLQRSFGAPERPSTMNMLGDVRPRPPPTGDLPPPRREHRSMFDQDWLGQYHHEYTPASLYNTYVGALGPPGHNLPHKVFSSLQLKPEMTEVERMRVVQMVAKGVTRWPTECRRKMAERTLEHVAWGDFGVREDMLRDEYCSVCHDEVGHQSYAVLTTVRGHVQDRRDSLQAHVSRGLSRRK